MKCIKKAFLVECVQKTIVLRMHSRFVFVKNVENVGRAVRLRAGRGDISKNITNFTKMCTFRKYI